MTNQEKELLFKKLVMDSHNSIYRVCYAFLNNEEDIKDLKQEIYIQIWKSIEQFEGKSSWNTFIYRIAVNVAIRFKGNLISHQQKMTDVKLEKVDPMNVTYIDNENVQYLKYFLKKLPDNERLIISLYFEGLSYKEIAEAMGLTAGHAGVKVQRIKQQLKIQIEKEHDRF